MRARGQKRLGKRFQRSIMVVGIACTALGVLAATAGMYGVTQSAADALSHEFLSRLVRQVTLNIDDNLRQIESLLINVELDQDFQGVLDAAAQNGGKGAPYESVRNLERKLLQTQLIRRDIKGFYVFDAGGRAYYCTSAPSLKLDYRLSDEPWFSALDDFNGPMFLGTHVPGRYLLDSTEVITMVQRLRNLKGQGAYATLVVDIKMDLFDNIVTTLDFSPVCNLLVLAPDGQLIYSNHGTRISGEEEREAYALLSASGKLEGGAEASFSLGNGAKKIIVDYTTSALTGWRTICWADVNGITAVPESIKLKMAAVTLASVLVTAACITLLVSRRFKTLNALNSGLETIRRGRYDVRVEPNARDEIGALCDTFNQMATQLNYLINTVDRLEKEKQEEMLRAAKAELDALQAQINPHFIYNTLETISMTAELNDDEETRKMATALGKLIRISVKGDNIVSVSEELEHVRCYLLIQRIRFDDKFRVVFDVEPEILGSKIPKLILQPLIENCIHHALEPIEQGGVIEITGRRSGNDLVFAVRDNGVGMPEEQLEALRKSIAEKYENEYITRRSIGLLNVNQRIKLYFADERYGLTIESKQGEGTTIEVRLPNIAAGEGNA